MRDSCSLCNSSESCEVALMKSGERWPWDSVTAERLQGLFHKCRWCGFFFSSCNCLIVVAYCW